MAIHLMANAGGSTSNPRYLRADRGGGGAVDVRGEMAGPWETFNLYDGATGTMDITLGGSLTSGTPLWFQSAGMAGTTLATSSYIRVNGNTVSADGLMPRQLTTIVGGATGWTIVRMTSAAPNATISSSSTRIMDGDTVALRFGGAQLGSSNRFMWLSAAGGGGDGTVLSDWKAIPGEFEKFKIWFMRRVVAGSSREVVIDVPSNGSPGIGSAPISLNLPAPPGGTRVYIVQSPPERAIENGVFYWNTDFETRPSVQAPEFATVPFFGGTPGPMPADPRTIFVPITSLSRPALGANPLIVSKFELRSWIPDAAALETMSSKPPGWDAVPRAGSNPHFQIAMDYATLRPKRTQTWNPWIGGGGSWTFELVDDVLRIVIPRGHGAAWRNAIGEEISPRAFIEREYTFELSHPFNEPVYFRVASNNGSPDHGAYKCVKTRAADEKLEAKFYLRAAGPEEYSYEAAKQSSMGTRYLTLKVYSNAVVKRSSRRRKNAPPPSPTLLGTERIRVDTIFEIK